MGLRRVDEVPRRSGGKPVRHPWYERDLREFVHAKMDVAELTPPEGMAKSKKWAANTSCLVNHYAKTYKLAVHACVRGDAVYLEAVTDVGRD